MKAVLAPGPSTALGLPAPGMTARLVAPARRRGDPSCVSCLPRRAEAVVEELGPLPESALANLRLQ